MQAIVIPLTAGSAADGAQRDSMISSRHRQFDSEEEEESSMPKVTSTVPNPVRTAAAPIAPSKAAKRRVSFKLSAPDARQVMLSGSFNEWSYEATPLKKDVTGAWRTQVSLSPGTYEYRFVVDGEWRDDPECPLRVENPFGSQNCVRIV
jgi:1,4-alpha-glucan branching enzyme